MLLDIIQQEIYTDSINFRAHSCDSPLFLRLPHIWQQGICPCIGFVVPIFLLILHFLVLGVWVRPGNQIVLSFSLQWKPDDSSKHYLTQLMLLTGGKNSRMRMKVKRRLKQVRFIEIHQVFGKKKK